MSKVLTLNAAVLSEVLNVNDCRCRVRVQPNTAGKFDIIHYTVKRGTRPRTWMLYDFRHDPLIRVCEHCEASVMAICAEAIWPSAGPEIKAKLKKQLKAHRA